MKVNPNSFHSSGNVDGIFILLFNHVCVELSTEIEVINSVSTDPGVPTQPIEERRSL